MKKIYLMRHAKSSWSEEGISDFDRPLNKRGERDLSFMANRLKTFNVKPNLIVSSPAKRAQKTTKTVAATISYNIDNIIYNKSLYNSSYDAYRDLLNSLDNKFNSLFIVAHNPTLTQIAERLSGQILINMPTCSIACIEFDIKNFKQIKDKSGKLLFFDYPKKHDLSNSYCL
ncbi:MAG: histidine phosphatase family protein [Sulfurospirillum sp.]|nr:histidine phosphatase family protein [Sulfurospirillum sp.]